MSNTEATLKDLSLNLPKDSGSDKPKVGRIFINYEVKAALGWLPPLGEHKNLISTTWIESDEIKSLRQQLDGRYQRVLLIAVESVGSAKIAVKFVRENMLQPKTAVVFINMYFSSQPDESKELLAEIRKVVGKDDIPGPSVVVEMFSRSSKEVGKVLCWVCSELDARVLIVGSRGLGKLKTAVIGSVSHYCATQAPCPVVITRNEQRV